MEDSSRKLEGKLIQNVWAENLEEEFARIREIVERYPVISMVSVVY